MRREFEAGEHGEAATAFMRLDDTVRIEMLDGAGIPICGAIDQTVHRAG